MLKKIVKETMTECRRSIIWLAITIYYIIKNVIDLTGETIRETLYDILRGLATICFLVLTLCELGMDRLVR